MNHYLNHNGSTFNVTVTVFGNEIVDPNSNFKRLLRFISCGSYWTGMNLFLPCSDLWVKGTKDWVF